MKSQTARWREWSKLSPLFIQLFTSVLSTYETWLTWLEICLFRIYLYGIQMPKKSYLYKKTWFSSFIKPTYVSSHTKLEQIWISRNKIPNIYMYRKLKTIY